MSSKATSSSATSLCAMLFSAILFFGLLGCGGAGDSSGDDSSNDSDSQSQTDPSSDQSNNDFDQDDSDADNANDDEQTNNDSTDSDQIVERSLNEGSSTSQLTTRLAGGDAIARIGIALEESLELGPTTIYWIVDCSSNAESFNRSILGEIARFYAIDSSEARMDRLTTHVVAFDDDMEYQSGELQGEASVVDEALAAITFTDSSTQNTCQVLTEIIDSAKNERRSGNEVYLVMITNEVPSDIESVDETCAALSDAGLLLFGVGLPAPFGLVGNESADGSGLNEQGLRCGPETRSAERVLLGYPTSAQSTTWLDSGFGPWALERLCRASGGRFLLVRDFDFPFASGLTQPQWPRRGARRFPDEQMSRFRPDYSDEATYQQSIEASLLRSALVEAAQQSMTLAQQNFRMEFTGGDPARLANELTQAQRGPAVVLPDLERLKLILQKGEPGLEAEQDPRWRVSFQLAYGRVLAAHSRSDGYNSLLAELKRGKTFVDESNDTWLLEETETFTAAGSSIRTASQKARNLLQGIIDEHPDTPWAYLAEQELSFPMGWEWTEVDRQ